MSPKSFDIPFSLDRYIVCVLVVLLAYIVFDLPARRNPLLGITVLETWLSLNRRICTLLDGAVVLMLGAISMAHGRMLDSPTVPFRCSGTMMSHSLSLVISDDRSFLGSAVLGTRLFLRRFSHDGRIIGD